MGLDSVVSIEISRTAGSVSRAGFGKMLFLGENGSFGGDKIREYASLTEVAEDFETSDEEYIAATRYFSQALKPESLFIGLRGTPVAQVVTFTPTPANTTVYSVIINGVTFTSAASDSDATAAEIVTMLAALVNAGSEPVTASGTSTLILTADEAGVPFTATSGGPGVMTKVTTTPNHGFAEDLDDILEENNDWYALTIHSRDPDQILQAAGWIEARRKIFIACNGDAGVIAAGSTDIASRLQALNYARTAYLYSGSHATYPECGWLGGQLPEDPGSSTYKFKTLVGSVADALTTTQESVAKAKGANTYQSIGGADITAEGNMAEGEFIDVIVGIDWIDVNMQADVYQVLVDEKKVPYTDQGIAVIQGKVENRLRLAVVATILAESPAPVVTVPLVADIDPSDKAARRLTGISFTATLAGAIHAVEITGNVSV